MRYVWGLGDDAKYPVRHPSHPLKKRQRAVVTCLSQEIMGGRRLE